MKKVISALVAWVVVLTAQAQSPNLTNSITRLQASDFQTRTEKGAASGYAPLTSGTLVDPVYLFPGWNAAADYSIWGKKDGTLQKLTGFSLDATGLTVNEVRVGVITGSQYGLAATGVTRSLFLKAGASSLKVFVANGQTFGGSNSGGTDFLWSIGSGGVFSLASGQLSGSLDLNSNSITEVATLSGGVMTQSFSSPGITLSSGDFTFTLNGAGKGVIVPSNASAVNTTYALNPVSANALYGRLASNNTFSGTNTFSIAPVVPSASWVIASTSGLQTALDLALKRDGSNAATANVNLGGFKILNLANPTLSGDAVSLSYLQSNYVADPVATLTASSPLLASDDTGAVTISLPAATGSVSGYLSSADWTTFNTKQGALSVTAPVVLVGSTVSMTQSGVAASGYLSQTDWNTFNDKESALTFSAPLVRTTNTISMPVATSVVSGYLASADWAIFNAKQAALTIGVGTPITLPGNVLTMPAANTSTSGYLTATDWNRFDAAATGSVTSLSISPGSPLTVSAATGVVAITAISATASTAGYVTVSDWNRFNNAANAATAMSGQVSLTDAATVSVDPSLGKLFSVTFAGDRTFSFSASHQAGRVFYVKIKQDGTGTRLATWDAAVRWPGGTAPTLTTTAGRSDLFMFIDTGLFFLGSTVALNYNES